MQAVLEQKSVSPKDKKQIKKNSKAYVAQLKTLANEVKTLQAHLRKKAKNLEVRVLVLSDALAYLARDVGWMPVVWSKEEESGFSPRELAALVELMQKDKIQIIMAEETQLKTAQTLASATKAQVILGSNLLQGPWEKDAYLHLMRQNLERIRDAVK
jgi:ABC-type Zn uptake system ZnuABC Zn-binding protein ZnuA